MPAQPPRMISFGVCFVWEGCEGEPTPATPASVLPLKMNSHLLSCVVQNVILSMIKIYTYQKGKYEYAYIQNSAAYTNKQG